MGICAPAPPRLLHTLTACSFSCLYHIQFLWSSLQTSLTLCYIYKQPHNYMKLIYARIYSSFRSLAGLLSIWINSLLDGLFSLSPVYYICVTCLCQKLGVLPLWYSLSWIGVETSADLSRDLGSEWFPNSKPKVLMLTSVVWRFLKWIWAAECSIHSAVPSGR